MIPNIWILKLVTLLAENVGNGITDGDWQVAGIKNYNVHYSKFLLNYKI